MRIIVISDTHRDSYAMKTVFNRNPDTELFIFLGDGERELEEVKLLHPDKKVLQVCGNCDFASSSPRIGTTKANNSKIIFLHGHSHGVKSGISNILALAKENDAQIILFGHTHQRLYTYVDGIHILNPGSASRPRDGTNPSYAYIDITKAGIVCNHVDIAY